MYALIHIACLFLFSKWTQTELKVTGKNIAHSLKKILDSSTQDNIRWYKKNEDYILKAGYTFALSPVHTSRELRKWTEFPCVTIGE